MKGTIFSGCTQKWDYMRLVVIWHIWAIKLKDLWIWIKCSILMKICENDPKFCGPRAFNFDIRKSEVPGLAKAKDVVRVPSHLSPGCRSKGMDLGRKPLKTGGKCTGKLQNPMVYHVPTKWLDGHLWRYTGIGWYRYIPFFWHTHLATGLSKIPRAPIERVCPRLTLGFAAPGHADSCSRPQGYPWNHPTASNEI